MKHLQKISQFLYFQLVSIFVVLIYLFHSYPDVLTQSFMYVYFALLLIPIIDIVVSWVFFRTFAHRLFHLGFFAGVIALIASSMILWFTGLFSIAIFLLLCLVFTWYFKIDGRIYFLWALLVFMYVLLGLLLWDHALAEWLSIIAYYLLIAGVIWQILENISLPKFSSHA